MADRPMILHVRTSARRMYESVAHRRRGRGFGSSCSWRLVLNDGVEPFEAVCARSRGRHVLRAGVDGAAVHAVAQPRRAIEARRARRAPPRRRSRSGRLAREGRRDETEADGDEEAVNAMQPWAASDDTIVPSNRTRARGAAARRGAAAAAPVSRTASQGAKACPDATAVDVSPDHPSAPLTSVTRHGLRACAQRPADGSPSITNGPTLNNTTCPTPRPPRVRRRTAHRSTCAATTRREITAAARYRCRPPRRGPATSSTTRTPRTMLQRTKSLMMIEHRRARAEQLGATSTPSPRGPCRCRRRPNATLSRSACVEQPNRRRLTTTVLRRRRSRRLRPGSAACPTRARHSSSRWSPRSCASRLYNESAPASSTERTRRRQG